MLVACHAPYFIPCGHVSSGPFLGKYLRHELDYAIGLLNGPHCCLLTLASGQGSGDPNRFKNMEFLHSRWQSLLSLGVPFLDLLCSPT